MALRATGRWRSGLFTVVLSCAAQIVFAFEFYLAAKGMHQHIHFVYFIIFSPLVCVATSLPSIGGLGVREVSWVYFLAKIGVHEGVAVGLSLLNFFFMVLVGLIGGALLLGRMSRGMLKEAEVAEKRA